MITSWPNLSWMRNKLLRKCSGQKNVHAVQSTFPFIFCICLTVFSFPLSQRSEQPPPLMRQHCVISRVQRVSAHSWFLGQKGDRSRAGGLTRCQGKSVPRFDYSRASPPLPLHWAHPNGQLHFCGPPPLRATGAKLFKGRSQMNSESALCPGEAAAAAAVESLSGFCDQPKSTMEKGTTEWKWSHAAIMTPKFGLFVITCVSISVCFMLPNNVQIKAHAVYHLFSSSWYYELRRVLCSL